ncbi:serine threonine protein kinase [Lichtheimia corymbifera JMRC:FSU:9682]|uniref:Serine threonine protein kinase n=1 Tax=Lichtheimia corymbifera JMRC:FSU:9682 TaxID=1263082 RepID=A0A068RLU5_9FUNG|nr:serine threonine protein kinase [Lichtheimia corymbifera JMRC:FSU:9682]
MCLPFSKSEHSKRGSVAPSSSSYLDNKRRNSTGAGITTHHHHNHHRRHFPLSSLHSQQQQQQQRRATSCSRRVLQQPLPTRPNMATAAFLDPTPPPSDQHHFPSSSQQRKQQHHQHHVLPPTPPKEKSTAPSSSSSPPRDHCASANPKSIGNYVLQQNLGKGSMGKVKLGVHNVTGEKVAVKIVPRANFQLVAVRGNNIEGGKTMRQQTAKEQAREHNRELRTIREAHIMMLLRHPHIVGLRDMVVSGPYFYIFMEHVGGGQLLHYIIKRQRLSERRARHFARQIVSALDYMHRNSIVHRDLKIENILLDKAGRNIKLIDFGLSNLFGPEKLLTTYCGSLYFAAPELLRANPYKGPEIDVWSLGVVIYVMVTGTVPFDDKSMPGLHDKIKRGHVNYPAHMSPECLDLLRRIFVTDPAKRVILTDVIRHPWLNPDPNVPPVKNFVPARKPIQLPLDETILEQMTKGFALGTADEIRQKLEVIVQSHVYQDAVQYIQQQHQQFASSSTSSTSLSPEEQRCIMPYDDPQSVPDAYHPLLSIYHLTRERNMELEGASNTMASASNANKPVLSRKASVESAISASGVMMGTASARSSQASLGNNQPQHDQQNKVEVPQGDAPVLPSSLPNRPDYQLLADASIPGFASQPSASSGDYLSRIQRWLRSSTSQHHLVVESPTPTPSSPLAQQQQHQHQQQQPFSRPPSPQPSSSTAQQQPPPPQQQQQDPLPTPPESTHNTTPSTTEKKPHTILRKISSAFLRGKQPVPDPSLYDRPLPPLPSNNTPPAPPAAPVPVAATPTLKYSKQQAAMITEPPQPQPQPSMSTSTTATTASSSKAKKGGHQRSASTTSAQYKRSLSVKISAWLNRSSSVHK